MGNFIQNLASPIYFVNHILQGNAELAAVTMLRAVVNTTMGIGGFVDVGREMGLEGVPTGFFRYVRCMGRGYRALSYVAYSWPPYF